jgi:spore maturation protein CgeB
MRDHLRLILSDASVARQLAESGLETIRTRHTCSHRVDELLSLCAQLETQSRLPLQHRPLAATAWNA